MYPPVRERGYLYFGRGCRRALGTVLCRRLTRCTPPRGRRQYVPVVTELDGVRLTHRLGSGSHLVASLHRADALAIVPEEREAVAVGDILEVVAL